jgi:hypothetical protein
MACNKGLSQDTTLTFYFNEITSGTEYSTNKEKLKFKKDVYVVIHEGGFSRTTMKFK